jgi:hypothetical protein
MDKILQSKLNIFSSQSTQIDDILLKLIETEAKEELSTFLLFDNLGRKLVRDISRLLKRSSANLLEEPELEHLEYQPGSRGYLTGGTFLSMNLKEETQADAILKLEEDLKQLLMIFNIRLDRFDKSGFDLKTVEYSESGIGITMTIVPDN